MSVAFPSLLIILHLLAGFLVIPSALPFFFFKFFFLLFSKGSSLKWCTWDIWIKSQLWALPGELCCLENVCNYWGLYLWMGLQLTGRFLVPESKRCSRSDQKCEIWPRLATPQPQHHLTQVPRDVIWFYQGGRGSTWARIRIANQLVKVTLGFHFHPKVALAPLTPHCQVPARKVRAWVETSAGLFAYTLLKLLFFI